MCDSKRAIVYQNIKESSYFSLNILQKSLISNILYCFLESSLHL